MRSGAIGGGGCNMFDARISGRSQLDVGFREADAQMVRFRQLVVVHLDQCAHGVLYRAQLYQRHLVVLPVNEHQMMLVQHTVVKPGDESILTGKT